MLKHASRSGQPGARVAACQTHLARRPVQTRARILPKQGRCPEAHQPARTTSPRSVRLGAGSPRAPARATQRTRKTHRARGGRPLRGAPIAFQKCGHDFDASGGVTRPAGTVETAALAMVASRQPSSRAPPVVQTPPSVVWFPSSPSPALLAICSAPPQAFASPPAGASQQPTLRSASSALPSWT